MRYHEEFSVIYKGDGPRLPGYKHGWEKVRRIPRGHKVPEGWKLLHEVCPYSFLMVPIYRPYRDEGG